MAYSVYRIQPCPLTGSSLNVLIDDSIQPLGSTRIHYLTFTGVTSEGCYYIVDAATGSTVDTVESFSVEYADCNTCEAVPTPTPTPTSTAGVTPTPTQTNTGTPAVTPSVTATKTPTPTPTSTAGVTPTPTQTNTGTPAVTPSVTATKTPTPTPTPSVTTTNTPTPTLTPTPSLSGFALSAGTEYFECRWCPDETPTAEAVPHAVYSNAQGRSVIQQNSVALGGFNGLNS